MLWGCSSVGRAPALQAGGQEFEPPQLHQTFAYRNQQPMYGDYGKTYAFTREHL